MQLIKYEEARNALKLCATVDEAKNILDKVEALRAYAKQQDDTEMEVWLAEVKLRARRRVGEISASLEKIAPKESGGMKKGIRTGANTSKKETLKQAGVSKDVAYRCEKIAEIPEEEFEEVISEAKEKKKPVTYSDVEKAAAKKAQKKKNDKLKESTPEPEFTGNYDVLVIDPPWPMKKIERDVRPNQVEFDYPTMNEDDLKKLDLPFNKNSHVFMWTTHKFLPMAFRLFEKWGVRYVCTFVWHKPGGFQPIGLPQYNCEFVLYGKVGSPKFIDTKAFNTCFEAPRGKHSEKPEEFYDLIRRVTNGCRIDIFNRREIKGFDVWGNEAA